MATPDPLTGTRALRTWASALRRAAEWADELDDLDLDEHDPAVPSGRDPAEVVASIAESARPGTAASAWALAKTAVGVLGSPVALPALTIAALRTAALTGARIDAFPEHLHAVAEGRPSPLPADRTLRLPAGERYLITSDLHRCIAGRLDWPARQRVKQLYADVLAGYARDDWHLIENGDVEDFWMVGGSTWGAVYDIAYLTGTAVGAARADARRAVVTEQLDRIVANNAEIYATIAAEFCATGRYHRTVGNHDDAFCDPSIAEHLDRYLPGVRVADTILLQRDGTDAAAGIDGVAAVVTHGHLTDSWNGPGFSPLGRAVTWLLTGLDDLPGMPRVDGLPDEADLGRLLGGRGRNRLITVDPRYGGNRRFDSMDEERLFDRLRRSEPDGGWPWMVLGHSHYPMLRPQDSAGRPTRYANSGCGVLEGAFSALEWDDGDPADPLRLVVWRTTPDGPRRIELRPDGPTLRPVD